MHDDNEVVVRYHVPAGTQAVRVSTTGSAFDTVLYALSTCDQAGAMMALACDNDSNDHPPQSTLYLTSVMDNQEVFLVVDGNGDAAMNMESSNGDFTLTVQEIPLGTQGNPCRPDPPDGMMTTQPPCDGTLRCSPGASDGTQLCVPAVALGQSCDPTGFMNACAEGVTCAEDPSPPDGEMVTAQCSMPGTHAGAPCRMMAPQCDSPLVCGTGDAPICVRVISAGQTCDPTGSTNQCAHGHTCRPTDDAGNATCS
jgi:hypothetical protein